MDSPRTLTATAIPTITLEASQNQENSGETNEEIARISKSRAWADAIGVFSFVGVLAAGLIAIIAFGVSRSGK